MPRPSRRVVCTIVAVLTAAALLAVPRAAEAEEAPRDGSTAARAAASCWEVKQVSPSAPDGQYWLLTPQLQAPTRFYCDMTTDGGGWVLVGRGRNGWTYDYNGKGTPAQVADPVTGPAAFAPRQLDANVVNALLGGRRFDSFPDGVRVRRAADARGTTWQEIRMTYRSRDRWTWALGGGVPVSSYSIDGAVGTNTSTLEMSRGTSLTTVNTAQLERNGWVVGFNYGQDVRGSTASDSYLYSQASGGAYATPFAQVFIRPRLRTSDLSYPSIPDSGTVAQQARAIPRSGALPQTWGVTGLGAGGTGELATYVQAFAQIGDVMYVGGNFTTVTKGPNATGADSVAQPYLAAFRASTGEWIDGFRPTLDNQVKALTALPDGRLAVGGDFTKVDGAARPGLAVLDSAGALDPAWTTTLENRVSSGPKVSVRALDTDGTHLYVGGSFTHLVRGTSAVYARNAGRLTLATRTADAGWNPDLNGTVTALDVADDRSRVYLAGYFTTSKGTTASRGAALSTAAGAASLGWKPVFSTGNDKYRYQQAVKQVGDKVWLGGSQHSMFGYGVKDLTLQSAHITRAGGDLQTIAGDDQLVYGGCHCGDWTYSDTTDYDGLAPGATNVKWSQVDKINLIGAWDRVTGAYVPDFTPTVKSLNGHGAWATIVAADGTLWSGGAYTSAVRENGSNQWVGGFVRFAKRPTAIPARPTSPAVTLSGHVATVSWSGPAGPTYEVLRGDRVVATTTGSSVKVEDSAAGDRFFVRASDGHGNRSASTAVVVAPAPASTAAPTAGSSAVTLVPATGTWSWYHDAPAVPASWSAPSFDATAWRTGGAPLGFGSAGLTTDVDVPAGRTRPLASYYRRTFTVTDPALLSDLVATVRADDGVAVWVNGTEVGRMNLPTGTLSGGTYATKAVSTATAAAAPATFTVPASLLVKGTNTVAVETHLNYRTAKDMSMQLTLAGRSR